MSQQSATTFVVLQASPADVGEIAPLFDLYRQFYGKTPNEEAARRFLFARLSKGESVVFYSRHDGKAAAFLQLYPVFSSTNLSRQWILNDLYVLPEARKQGHGRALLERAHRLAEETQANGLVLETAVTNEPAQRLYESLGWKRDDEFYRYYLAV
jgi:ribosomal protein S18 acetylase RimI-like enzyme